MTTLISESAALRRIATPRNPSGAVAAIRCRIKRRIRRAGITISPAIPTRELIALAKRRAGIA